MDGSGAFPSGPQLSLEQFGGLFPLFGILFEVGLCDLLYEWPLPETRQDHQPILGAQLRGVCPYLGIRQVPREAIERGHTCLLGAGTSDEAGLLARVCVGPRGEGSHRHPVLLGPGENPGPREHGTGHLGTQAGGPLPHPGMRINSIPRRPLSIYWSQKSCVS